MQEMKPVKEGKVREIYDNGDSLIMVATDRRQSILLVVFSYYKTKIAQESITLNGYM